jgi:hypothetical protein
MVTDGRAVAHSSLSRVILYVTVLSGFAAAYLMYRRGEIRSFDSKKNCRQSGRLIGFGSEERRIDR